LQAHLVYLQQEKTKIENKDVLKYVSWMERLVASEFLTDGRFPTLAKKLFAPELVLRSVAVSKNERVEREQKELKALARDFLDGKVVKTSEDWFTLPNRDAARFLCAPGINERFAFYLNAAEALEDKRLYGLDLLPTGIPTEVFFANFSCKSSFEINLINSVSRLDFSEQIILEEKVCIFCNTKLEDQTSECPSCALSQHPRTLVDWEIEELIKRRIIVIEPILNLKEQMNPGGIDLRLDTRLKEFKFSEVASIDPTKTVREHEYYSNRELECSKNESYILHPREFVLAQSFEYVALPNFVLAGLDGRSSFGRLGVVVHSTAGSIDPGFCGHITFELSNLAKMPIKLKPLTRIARLSFHVTEKCRDPYSGPYQFQSNVTSSRSFLDTKES